MLNQVSIIFQPSKSHQNFQNFHIIERYNGVAERLDYSLIERRTFLKIPGISKYIHNHLHSGYVKGKTNIFRAFHGYRCRLSNLNKFKNERERGSEAYIFGNFALHFIQTLIFLTATPSLSPFRSVH